VTRKGAVNTVRPFAPVPRLARARTNGVRLNRVALVANAPAVGPRAVSYRYPKRGDVRAPSARNFGVWVSLCAMRWRNATVGELGRRLERLRVSTIGGRVWNCGSVAWKRFEHGSSMAFFFSSAALSSAEPTVTSKLCRHRREHCAVPQTRSRSSQGMQLIMLRTATLRLRSSDHPPGFVRLHQHDLCASKAKQRSKDSPDP
jgi:hypothetical protein